GDGADLDEAEAEGAPSRHSLGVLIETGLEPEQVREADAKHLATQRRMACHVVPGRLRAHAGVERMRAHGQPVSVFGIEREQRPPQQAPRRRRPRGGDERVAHSSSIDAGSGTITMTSAMTWA